MATTNIPATPVLRIVQVLLSHQVVVAAVRIRVKDTKLACGEIGENGDAHSGGKRVAELNALAQLGFGDCDLLRCVGSEAT